MDNKKDYERVFNDLKRRQALRQNEPELRDLKQKLENDLVRKTQICQIKEKEYSLLREKFDAAREADIINDNHNRVLELDSKKTDNQQKFKESYRNELKLQINLNEISKANEQKIRELERLEVEKELESLDEEYKKYWLKKKQLIEQIQKERQIFIKAREAEKRKNYLLSLEEARRMDEINQELEERLRKQEEYQRKKLQQREALNDRIAKTLEEQKNVQLERDRLIEELKDYDNRCRQNILYQERNKKDDRNIQLHREILKKQIEAHSTHEKVLKELEYNYKIQLLNDIKKYEYLDQVEKNANKKKQIQYAEDIKEQMEFNMNKQKETDDLIKMTNDYIRQCNAAREQQIQEEMNRMKLEHKHVI